MANSLPIIDQPEVGDPADTMGTNLCIARGRTVPPPQDHFPGRCFAVAKATQPTNAEFVAANQVANIEYGSSGSGFEPEWQINGIDLGQSSGTVSVWFKHTWRAPSGGDQHLEANEIWASQGAAQLPVTINPVSSCSGYGGSGTSGNGPGEPDDGSPSDPGEDSAPFSLAAIDTAAKIGSNDLPDFTNRRLNEAARLVPDVRADWKFYFVPGGSYLKRLELNAQGDSLRARTIEVCVPFINVTSERKLKDGDPSPLSPVSINSTLGLALKKAKKRENWLFIGEPQYAVCIWQGARSERTKVLSNSLELPTKIEVDICRDIYVDLNHQRDTRRVGHYVVAVRVLR